MRGIETQEEIKKKERRRARFFSIFMLLILVGSTIGFAFFYSPTGQNQKSNQGNANQEDEEFFQSGNAWNVNIGGEIFSFANKPSEVRDIEVETSFVIGDYTNRPLYIDASEAAYIEIGSTLGRYSERTQKACYDSCNNSELPEKNCTENLIILESSQENKVYQNDRCIFIEGDIKAVDAFLFKTLGFE